MLNFRGHSLATVLLAGVVGACAGHSPAATPHPVLQPIPGTPVVVQPASPSDTAGSAAPLNVMETPFWTLDRRDWPGPNQYRDASGAPGPDYWQQRADYNIAATLDTATQTLTGTVTVRYTNNSPDTLPFVWMHLDQNLFRAGSEGSYLFPSNSRNAAAGFNGGYILDDVTVDGTHVSPEVDGTLMRLDLSSPIAARGGRATIAIRYHFRVPEHGADRMGHDGALYELAQWYPRMVVYDDVRGWNIDQYLGQGEFYLEYGDIEYAVTVPAGYIVGGTGTLENGAEALTVTERERLARAAHDTTVVAIITGPEASAGAHAVPGMKTWRFRAANVRDVAWGAGPDMRWDATWTGPLAGNRAGVVCQSYYQEPKAGAEWTHAAENTQWTIRTYSQLTGYAFPYPQATSFAGTVSGMEYPMFVMVEYGSASAPGDVFRTIDHEHGHEWFPMIVGSNERLYGWMDEGVNTYMNAFSQERRYGADLRAWPSGMDNWASFLGAWSETVGAGIDRPLMERPDHVPEMALANVAYEKPAAVLLALRDHVVDRTAFDRAFREYVRRWAFRHPTPGDFFRTVQNVTGVDLSWFWRGFFYTTAVLDVAIDSVATRPAADRDTTTGRVAVVFLRRNSDVVFPVDVRLGLANGTTTDLHIPVDVWARGQSVAVEVLVGGAVKGARLWPNRTAVPDLKPDNDTWGDAPAGDRPGPATTGGLASPIASR